MRGLAPGLIRIGAAFRAGAVRRMALLGFAAGLPLPLVFGTLSFRLREAGVDLATIGFVSWVALVYAFKWVWSPLVDQVRLPALGRRLGQRRSWLILAQAGVIGGLAAMAAVDPAQQVGMLVAAALATAFAAATQDIALDAYRIESAPAAMQPTVAAAYQAGYRIAMIWSSAGALWLAAYADHGEAGYHAASWRFAYAVMALTMLVGVVTALVSPPVDRAFAPSEGGSRLRSAVIEPLLDFWRRYRGDTLRLLALVALYRLPDIVAGVMANPFYRDLGFTKSEVATVSKFFGVALTIVGALIGGALGPRLGILATLRIGAAGAAIANLGYAGLALVGHDLRAFACAVSIDNLSTGIAGSAFIAYLSALTNLRFSATQYALLSSMMLLLPKAVAGLGGIVVERIGYAPFFCIAAALALPGWALIGRVARTGRIPGPAESPNPKGLRTDALQPSRTR